MDEMLVEVLPGEWRASGQWCPPWLLPMACRPLTTGLQQMALATCSHGAAHVAGDGGRELHKRPVVAVVGQSLVGGAESGQWASLVRGGAVGK